MWIYVFDGLMVKARVTNQKKKYQKQGFFVVIWFMVTFDSNMISVKSIFISNLSFINP